MKKYSKRTEFLIEVIKWLVDEFMPNGIETEYHLFVDDLETDWEARANHKYQRHLILFNERVSEMRDMDFEQVFCMVIHELAHYYTWVGNVYLLSEKYNLSVNMWENMFVMLRNPMVFIEEMITVNLENTMLRILSKTDKYKKMEKKFKNIK